MYSVSNSTNTSHIPVLPTQDQHKNYTMNVLIMFVFEPTLFFHRNFVLLEPATIQYGPQDLGCDQNSAGPPKQVAFGGRLADSANPCGRGRVAPQLLQISPLTAAARSQNENIKIYFNSLRLRH